MANISTQYLYTGKGPFDAKQSVQTLQKLLDPNSYGNYPYNGMVVGVGLDSDQNNNGIYYLYDSSVKNARGTPDVTIRDNWHKLTDSNEVQLTIQTFKDEVDTTLTAVSNEIKDIEVTVTAFQNITTGIGDEGDIYLTVIDAIDKKIAANNNNLPIATADKVGGIKSNASENKLSVLTDGSAEVHSLNVNKLTQTEGDVLTLDGGTITI